MALKVQAMERTVDEAVNKQGVIQAVNIWVSCGVRVTALVTCKSMTNSRSNNSVGTLLQASSVREPGAMQKHLHSVFCWQQGFM